MLVSPRYRIIIASLFSGPTHTSLGKSLQPSQVTPLRYVSDVMYLVWENQCKSAKVAASSLKYYLASNVVNEDTRNAVRDAVGGYLQTNLSDWPGIEFTNDNDHTKFAAVLGTPVVSPLGRLVAQRKNTMGDDRKIVSARLWKQFPNDIPWIKEHGPSLYMLFKLSDQASVAEQPASGGRSTTLGQRRPGANMPAGSWSQPSGATVQGQNEGASGSFDDSLQQGMARARLEDTLQRSGAGSDFGPASRGGGTQPTTSQGATIAPQATMLARRHNFDEIPGDHRPTESLCTSRINAVPFGATQTSGVLRKQKLMKRMDRYDRPAVDPSELRPRPGFLPFAQHSEDSEISQATGYDVDSLRHLEAGEHRGPSGQSFTVEKATQIGTYWTKRLGSDTISPDDEAQLLENYDQGPGDYGYKKARWPLPQFDGLEDILPGFRDASGKPDESWTPMKWVHLEPWVDDENFKHHPVSYTYLNPDAVGSSTPRDRFLESY